MSLRTRLLANLPFSKNELNLLIASAPIRYKEYSIPKRQPNKRREVSQPTPEIKLIQRWVVENELNKFPIHESARAYKKNVGLIANVLPHKNNRYLLKVDFKDFFPSITNHDFRKFMIGTEFSDDDLHDLSQILFKADHKTKTLRLAIGAPSSPLLSNILLYSLDSVIHDHCKEIEVTYTRYADDLSFSTNRPNLLTSLYENLPILISSGTDIHLTVNIEKTVHTSKGNGRRITGLTITEKNEISIGRERKRILNAQVFRFKNNLLSIEDIEKLKGYISFLRSVEPEHINRLIQKYGESTILALQR
ncbi:retron St85 family RNA-directed DNA polymerase [Undibacterium flavidum]|uniref:RNA-directed DNA polymerase n=1 Tax=Undibacterium flavidum TaxID=2762297 RepID=A0ABR6YG68_9BURK|nr:retron St85 family RNA-directed DNA polymerase [Undibacterium flavidum]MBC3875574.1 RNA-directed DNA polymerase [Undibacterium flavidum]